MKIGIMGSGAFGTALAVTLSQVAPVVLWGRDAAQIDEARRTRKAPRLPDFALPETISLTSDMRDLGVCDAILMSVPMQTLAQVLDSARGVIGAKPVIACCKGIERETLRGADQVIATTLPDAVPAILTGPSFAADIAAGLPTALTIACAEDAVARHLQSALSTPNLRLYRSNDIRGAAFGGAVKNVIAIASGAAMGAGLGESARASIITRGFAELQRIAEPVDARPETLAGLSGFGDLILTCTSEQSRNYRFGQAIGRGEGFDPSITVEGAATARAVADLGEEFNVDMPLCRTVADLCDGSTSIQDAIVDLLSRRQRSE